MTDVIVIGGGLAGLAAARTLAEHGAGAVVVEAGERVGGRVQTLYAGHATLPVELGPEFVHGAPGATHDLVREAGLELEPILDTHLVSREHHVTDGGDMWNRFGELLAGVHQVRGDESARRYIVESGMSREDAELFASFVEGFYGASLDDISIASIAGDASGLGGDQAEQGRVRGGYGRLVDWLSARLARDGVPVRCGSAVHEVDWTGEGVRVELAGGTLEADHAIVTLPVGVLADPVAVRFTPELDDTHRAALARLAMGQVVKIVVCLRDQVWEEPRGPRELAFVHRGEHFPTFWMRTRDHEQQLTAWAGGEHASALAGISGPDLAQLALDDFASAVGMPRARLAAVVRDFHWHDFAADPWARGAYSYTRVGGTGAAEDLARPLDNKVFFAGEATDAQYEGTVAGALASGTRAARQVLANAMHGHRSWNA